MKIFKTFKSLKIAKIWVNVSLGLGLKAVHLGRQNGVYMAAIWL